MIKRHLKLRHGLSVAQYKTRWKLPSDYSTTAPNYSEHRSQLAKTIGLGRGRAAEASATEKPSRRRSASKTTRTRTTAPKAGSKDSVKKAERPVLQVPEAASRAQPARGCDRLAYTPMGWRSDDRRP
jgi:hypothetical protein